MIYLQTDTLILVSSISIVITIFVVVCVYLYVQRLKRNRQIANANRYLIYPSPAPITTNRFVYPLTKPETFNEFPLKEIPSNYKTFDLTKRSRHHLSSDSSYGSSTQHHSSSKNQSNSDSDDIDNETSSPSFEYSLIELFRLELVYKLYYSIDDNRLNFEIIRLTPMQKLIEQCFTSLICKIRLFTDNDKHKNAKYLSKKNPINELFQFDLNGINLDKSYLKLHVLGHYHNDKRFEIGQTVLVIQQLNNHMEQYTKLIQIYEDRIDMIIREQAKTENQARALICLVYENDRCLLHIGLIKMLGIHYLLKQFHHRDQIRIKISTIIDGKTIAKRKSKLISISDGICTFSTSFQCDYVSLDKTSICITISYRRSLISSQSKIISKLEFGSTQLKNQQTFQHWTDTISAPNRPHVHWHILQAINEN